MENIPKILEKYLNYLIAVKGCSSNTIKAFRSDLMQFFNFIKFYKEIPVLAQDINVFILLQINESDIIAFSTYLNYNRDNSPYTRQRKISSLRSFYKWLFASFSVSNNKKNPTLGLTYIKKVEKFPKHLTLDQAKKILKAFNLSNTRFPERNNAIISLFLSTGIRLSELIGINLGDVNLEDKTIVVFGKNSKERIVYFNNDCRKFLIAYINTRHLSEGNIRLDSPLFLNKFKNRVGVDAIQNICKKAYKLIDVQDFGYTTHTLRHTSATIMYTYVKNDILLIKEFLGHSSISSTQIYTHLSNNDIREAVERNPLNNYKREGKKCN